MLTGLPEERAIPGDHLEGSKGVRTPLVGLRHSTPQAGSSHSFYFLRQKGALGVVESWIDPTRTSSITFVSVLERYVRQLGGERERLRGAESRAGKPSQDESRISCYACLVNAFWVRCVF